MEELKKRIKRLKKGKSPGTDGYPPELFMRAGDGLLIALLEMFNVIKELRVPRAVEYDENNYHI